MNKRYLQLIVAVAAILVGCSKTETVDSGDVRPLSPAAAPDVYQVIEAETLSPMTGVFKAAPAEGSSNNQALIVPSGIAAHGKIVGSTTFATTVGVAAPVKLWLRAKWTGTCSNSVIVKAPGVPPKIVGETATYHTWHWVEGPQFEVQPGPITIDLQAREDGIFIDELILTSDLVQVPVGIETPTVTALPPVKP